MGRGPTDQIVAAIVGRSDHEVTRAKRVERLPESRCRQVRAIAVESDDATPANRAEMRKNRRKTGPKAFTRLRHYLHSVAAHARQVLDIGSRAHDRRFHTIE